MIWESSIEGFIASQSCIYTAIMELLQQWAAETPDRPVIISAQDATEFFTYKELIDKIHAVESFLHNIGFGKLEVAATVMNNVIDIVTFFLAVLGRGGVYTGMGPGFTTKETTNRLEDCRASVVFTTAQLLDKVKTATTKYNMKIICMGGNDDSSFNWQLFLQTEGKAPRQLNTIDDVALMPYSSGTTGLPKGVLLTHKNIVAASLNFKRHLSALAPQPPSATNKK